MITKKTLSRFSTQSLLTICLLPSIISAAADPRAKVAHPEVRQSFYEAINGEWLASNEIPADKSGISNFSVIQDDISADLRKLFEEKRDGDSSSEDFQKAHTLYHSYLNTDSRNKAGLSPIQDDLDEIDDLDTHEELGLHFAELFKNGVQTPVVWVVGPDFRNSKAHLLWVVQNGLGLPARAMYLDNDTRSKGIVDQYTKYLTTLFTVANIEAPSSAVEKVVALERSLATIQ